VTETKTAAVPFWPFAASSAAACALGIAVSMLLPGGARAPALYGAVAASLGALCGLAALKASVGRGVNGVLAGFSIGFLCRAILVAAGLLASGARGNLALVYVAAFFALYAATQVIEVLFVHQSSRSAMLPSAAAPRPAEPPSSGATP
jgi:hypothetical protein